MKVFVSYSHKQTDWVRDDLVPVLEAGGAEVLVDWKEFIAGRTVIGQMDGAQDRAERHLLCLSADYLASAMCLHEFRRAVATDPNFEKGNILPIRLDDSPLPDELTAQPPLWIDFQKSKQPESRHLLLDSCRADVGIAAPAWLKVRDALIAELQLGTSINFVVLGHDVAGERLLKSLGKDRQPDLALVDLQNPATIPRDGFCASVLRALGLNVTNISRRPNDLAEFAVQLQARGFARVALINFDMVIERKDYNQDFYGTMRWLIGRRRWYLAGNTKW